MIHEESYPVTKEMTRGHHPTKCYYCDGHLGGHHTLGCVCRQKSVVVEYRVTVVERIPEHWTREDFMFHHNEGSWCANNLIDELGRHFCACRLIEATSVRDATKDEVDDYDQAPRNEDNNA